MDRQTDGDRQDPWCGLLRRPHNKSATECGTFVFFLSKRSERLILDRLMQRLNSSGFIQKLCKAGGVEPMPWWLIHVGRYVYIQIHALHSWVAERFCYRLTYKYRWLLVFNQFFAAMSSIFSQQHAIVTGKDYSAWLNALASINEDALCQAWLLLGWVTVCWAINHLGI